MSTDRELLTWAAHAVGFTLLFEYTPLEFDAARHRVWKNDGDIGMPWNPLADDGDAHRLAVALQLTVCNEHLSAGTVYCQRGDTVFDGVWSGTAADVSVEPQDYVATRRAIVLAAAQIGKQIGV